MTCEISMNMIISHNLYHVYFLKIKKEYSGDVVLNDAVG